MPTTRGLAIDYKPFFQNDHRPVRGEQLHQMSEETYKVHKVVRQRTRNGCEEILVAWSGWPGVYSWEPKHQMVGSIGLLITDQGKPQPELTVPSDDLVFQNLSHFAYAIQHVMSPENDPQFNVPFAENVYRHVFGKLPQDSEGWTSIERGDLACLYPKMFVHVFKKSPGEGRQPDYPLKVRPIVKQSGPYMAEFLAVKFAKDNRPLDVVEDEVYDANHDEEEL